jgi:hypothetical protein
MSHLPYDHALTPPLTVVLFRWLVAACRRLIGPALSRLLPGEKGRRILTWILWALGLVLQLAMIWMLQQLVDLCIDLYELWAFMATQFVAK